MTLPDPLTPEDCDLRGFPFMPLHVQRLRDSELAGTASPEACWAAVLLWCASWHQVPAASVPNSPRLLAALAGYGRDVAAWEAVAAEALHGFVECSDGRLYHPVVADQALQALGKKVKQSEKGRLSGEARRAKRDMNRGSTAVQPPFNRGSTAVQPPFNRGSTAVSTVVEQQTGTGTGTGRETDRQSARVTQPVDNFEKVAGEVEAAPSEENNRPPSFRGGSVEAPRGDEADGVGGAGPAGEINSPPSFRGGIEDAPQPEPTASAAKTGTGSAEGDTVSPGKGVRTGRARETISALAWQVETQLQALGISDCKRTSSVLLEQLQAGHFPEEYLLAANALAEHLKRKPGSVKKPFGWILATVGAQYIPEQACKPALQPSQDQPATDPEVKTRALAQVAALAEQFRAKTRHPVRRARTA